MGPIYYLSYVSQMTLKAGISPKALADIMKVAQSQNRAHQLTGFLCFGNGYFFQYLEGEKQAVEQLFDNIQRDIRNRNVTLTSSGAIEKRLFQDWQMLMININNPDTPEEIITAFEPMQPNTSKRQQADKLVELMRLQYNRRTLIDFDNYAHKNVSYYGISLRALAKAHRHFLLLQSVLLLLIVFSLLQL